MAGVDLSNRDLWQFITGSSLTKPKKLVGEELERNRNRFKLALKYYVPPRTPAGEILTKERKLDNTTVEFIKKLSQFLGLNEVKSHDLYKAYISREYRGTTADLQTALTVERHTQTFVAKLRDFYNSERLYLLRSIKHVLSYWKEPQHPYQTQYATVVQGLYDSKDFMQDILQQYDKICEETAPTWETRGKFMSDRHSQLWVIQNLKEQSELLEIMILYHSHTELSCQQLVDLANKFKRQGFGRRQVNRHLLDERAEPLLQKLGFLQIVLLIEGLDMEDLLAKHRAEKARSHHVVSHAKFDSLDQYIETLGQIPAHGPLLLAWAALRELSNSGEEAKTSALGNRALGVKVFPYLVSRLQAQPFSGKSVVAKFCYSVIYGLMCAVLEAFHQDTLGDKDGLQALASTLLKQSVLAEDFWKQGLESGLGPLFQFAASLFPLDVIPFVQLCTSLGGASMTSSLKVVKAVQNMDSFTEIMTSASEVKATKQQFVWQLMRDRHPYQTVGSDLVIGRGTLGEYRPIENTALIQWQCAYDGWEVLVSEIQLLLQQVSHGSGMVQMENVHRVTEICRLIHAACAVYPDLPSSVIQMSVVPNLLYQVINRFSQVTPPPVEILAASIQVIHQLALKNPSEVWIQLQQTGLLPHLTENIDNFAEVANGSGLNAGAYGNILAGSECTQGKYPLTIAFLDLVSALIQPLSQIGEVDKMLACILIVTREIFPMFGKWRYFNITSREKIGQKCLEIFHKVLNILGQGNQHQENRVSVRQVCVYSLLFTEAGQALLDIVATSVDTVNAALASLGSSTDGAGIELVQMIRMAFSVLNRLLLLRPTGAPPSPVEHSLSAQAKALGGRNNAMATIAQYIYHRHDPRLATLATVLLKRLAMIFPMSILACLGEESEPIRDVFLSRLQAENEDVRLKVVILELLSVCVDSQPGLIEIFLNVTVLMDQSKPGDSKKTSTKDKKETNQGKVSCLQTVLSLIDTSKQGTYECPSQLLCAAIEFIHALWHGRRETAMAALREIPGFWHSVCLSLTRQLQSPAEAEADLEVLQKEVKSCADIMKILALELYHNQGSKLDDNLKNVLTDILSEDKLLYWSKYLRDSMQWSSEQAELAAPHELMENATLQLLSAWRNLLLVLGQVSSKNTKLGVPDAVKEKILQDLLQGIFCQFSSDREVTRLNIKLASLASAFYLTLLKKWISHLKDWAVTVEQIEAILGVTLSCCESLIPSVQIGLVGALSLILQHTRHNKCQKPLTDKHLACLVPITCSMIQQSTYQLPPPPAPLVTSKTSQNMAQNDQNSGLDSSGLHTSSLSQSGFQHNRTVADISRSRIGDQSMSRLGDMSRSRVADLSRSKLGESHMETGEEKPVQTEVEGYDKELEVKLKLQTVCLCMLEELVVSLPSPDYWLPEVKEYSLLQTLLASVEVWMQAHQGADYVQAVMLLLLTLTRHPQGAECLAVSSFIQQLCLLIPHLYNHPITSVNNSSNSNKVGTSLSQPASWSSIYCLSLGLYTSLLDTLKYNFLRYSIEFVGVHQDRMHQCLETAGVQLRQELLDEAAETCRFISELSVYRREWRLQLPQVLQRLMTDVCLITQRCVSLLIRPNLLQHMLQRQRAGQDALQSMTQDKLVAAPFIRSMSQQPADDVDHPTQDVMAVQNRLLTIVCQCLIALRKFSPDLCEIVLDQSLDVSEYEAFLQIGFSTPAVEQDTPPTFGTLVSCISLCLYLLNKTDTRGGLGTPPNKTDNQATDKIPIDRNLITFVLENALYLMMSQSLRGLKDPNLSTRDKQLLKRELSAELNSFLLGMARHLRRGSGAQTPSAAHVSGSSTGPFAEANYLKLVDVFVRKVLR